MQKSRSEEEVARVMGLMDAEALRASQRLATCDPDIRSALHHAYSMGYRKGWLRHQYGNAEPDTDNPFTSSSIESFIQRMRFLGPDRESF